MHGTLTPEQVNLIEINRKRALDLQKTLRVIRDMKRTLAELEEEAERLKKPVSLVIDMTKDSPEPIHQDVNHVNYGIIYM